MFKKPQVILDQKITTASSLVDASLPTILVGPRYDVSSEVSLGGYIKDANTEYNYPNIPETSKINEEYTKLFMKDVIMNFYSNSHTWRKLGVYSNKIRTILSDGLIFKSSTDYIASSIFKDRGVKLNDYVKVDTGTKVIETTVVGYEADKSVSSINPVVSSIGNKQTTAGSIGASTAGTSNSGTSSLTSNTGGTYTGSLYDNILEETYTVKVIEAGTKPVNSVISNDNTGLVPSTNEIYDFSSQETYTITIITGGALGIATYIVTSQSGMDNMPEQVTPLSGVFTELGSRGAEFAITGTDVYTSGQTFVISCTPSTAKLSITSDTYSEIRVFPGFNYQFSIRYGVAVTIGVLTVPNMVVNDYWTIACKKQLDLVTAVSSGTFVGTQDINYAIEVIQGGEYGQAVVRVNSTGSDTNKLATVPVTRIVNIGEYGVVLTFDTNVQNGLIKGDTYFIECISSKDTAYRTLILKDGLPADNYTIGSAIYAGSVSPYNTGTSSGTFSSTNKSLDLYSQEVYTVIISTGGTYGVAQYIVTSSSGLDNNLTPVTIPVTPGTLNSVGSYGLKIAFTGTEAFSTSNRWTINVSKGNLNITLGIPLSEIEVPKEREENEVLSAWYCDDEIITVNSDIKHFDAEWNGYLPIYKSNLLTTYSALNTLGSNDVHSISSYQDIVSKLGVPHKDNTIAQAAELALLNNSNSTIYACYPSSNDVAGWSSMLNKLELRDRSQVYRFAVLTFDESIIDSVVNHVNKMSDRNKWRVAYICREIQDVITVVSGTAKIEEDLSNPGNYTIMTSTDMNFSLCRVGDTVTYLSNTYTIVSIRTPSEIEINTSLSGPQTVASSSVVSRELSSDEVAQYYVFYNQKYKNRRVVSVIPDTFVYNDVIMPGYYLTAILAGLRSGLPPHQSITNYSVSGVSDLDVYKKFTEEQFDIIANGGSLIVTKDSYESVPYIRHQVTTNTDTVKYRELSITENVDSISYDIVEECKKFIGKYNLHTGVINQIKTNVEGILFAKTQNTSVQAGPQVLSYEITKFQQSSTAEDTLEIEITLVVSSPLNYIYVTLIV